MLVYADEDLKDATISQSMLTLVNTGNAYVHSKHTASGEENHAVMDELLLKQQKVENLAAKAQEKLLSLQTKAESANEAWNRGRDTDAETELKVLMLKARRKVYLEGINKRGHLFD